MKSIIFAAVTCAAAAAPPVAGAEKEQKPDLRLYVIGNSLTDELRYGDFVKMAAGGGKTVRHAHLARVGGQRHRPERVPDGDLQAGRRGGINRQRPPATAPGVSSRGCRRRHATPYSRRGILADRAGAQSHDGATQVAHRGGGNGPFTPPPIRRSAAWQPVD